MRMHLIIVRILLKSILMLLVHHLIFCSAAKNVEFKGRAAADLDQGVLNIGLDLRNIIKQTIS